MILVYVFRGIVRCMYIFFFNLEFKKLNWNVNKNDGMKKCLNIWEVK